MAREKLVNVALVGAGACAGTFARYALVAYGPQWGLPYSLPILVANLVGALLIGLLLGHLAGLEATTAGSKLAGWKLFATTGFCGGLTTYSTLMVEFVTTDTTWLALGFHALLAFGIGIPAAALGYLLGRQLGRNQLGRRHLRRNQISRNQDYRRGTDTGKVPPC